MSGLSFSAKRRSALSPRRTDPEVLSDTIKKAPDLERFEGAILVYVRVHAENGAAAGAGVPPAARRTMDIPAQVLDLYHAINNDEGIDEAIENVTAEHSSVVKEHIQGFIDRRPFLKLSETQQSKLFKFAFPKATTTTPMVSLILEPAPSAPPSGPEMLL